jgi:hypothetical protein
MALRDKLQKAVAPYLESGETVQAVFAAQTKSANFALISYWILVFKKAWRVVAVTEHRIVVFRCGRGGTTKVEGIATETRRHTRIGPTKGLWYRVDNLGERLYVHKRFHKDIDAADAWATDARGVAPLG